MSDDRGIEEEWKKALKEGPPAGSGRSPVERQRGRALLLGFVSGVLVMVLLMTIAVRIDFTPLFELSVPLGILVFWGVRRITGPKTIFEEKPRSLPQDSRALADGGPHPPRPLSPPAARRGGGPHPNPPHRRGEGASRPRFRHC